MELLKSLCNVHAPAGEEYRLTEYLINYIDTHKHTWNTMPTIIAGEGFQDNIMLIFGEPKTAVFAHIDSIGFTVKYDKELVKIGGPKTEEGLKLKGFEMDGTAVSTSTIVTEEEDGTKLTTHSGNEIERGTALSFECDFRLTEEYVQSCYLDNRLGVWTSLELCKTMENGAIVFSTWEEHGGGSVSYLAKYLADNYKISQGLIADITWVTKGVTHGNGVAISLRDSLLPRRSFVNRIIAIAKKHQIKFQLEVENAGGSDAKELQNAAHPWDWCFIGAPEDFVHTPNEKVHLDDIKSMVALYQMLLKEL
ncbi:MAG: putative aminopeptidase FrvX [Flavobacteriales bacterium]|jgi:putative aminopeptidase FrvX